METQEKGETPARFFFLIASPTLHLLCKDDQCLFLSILASKIEKDITDIMVSNKLIKILSTMEYVRNMFYIFLCDLIKQSLKC